MNGPFDLDLRHKDVTRGVGAVYSSYTHLMTMLAQGWEIEPPIYVRPRSHSLLRSRKENIYHFILWHGDRVGVVSVLDCQEIRQFLVDKEFPVDRL